MTAETYDSITRTYTLSQHLARYAAVDREILSVEIPIPQREYSDVDEYVAVFGARGLLDVVDEVELRKELIHFIRGETQKYQDERDDALIMEALERGFDLPDIDNNQSFVVDPLENFANKFSFVMHDSSSAELAELMRRQIAMVNEMNQIIRVRNWEVAQLTNKCENAVNDASSNVDVHPHELSKLNEKLRNLHASYACQVEGLSERQRKEFRDLVDVLYEGGSILDSSSPVGINTSGTQGWNPQSKIEGIEEIYEGALNESYTIYIGAQLKSMHNVRLLTANSMVELCTPVKGVDVSSLLQMSISLYGRQLSGLVMLVPRDPLWHSSSGSEFARVCEQSTELHFDPLPKQLQDVVESNNTKAHDAALEVGDVYCTRHSNLRDVQLVFHLVVDDALHSSDLSSRHPCLNGIRNIIRLTVRLGITSIHIPLLLVEQASENMTIAWCVRRAEMVYKCVKGYLMEVCGVCGGSAVGGGVTSVPHFNIHLVLPSGLADGVYQQISAMVSFTPLAARYPSAHRRALAAYDLEGEDLVAAIASVHISTDRAMQPDINSCEVLCQQGDAEDECRCGDAGSFYLSSESKPRKLEYLSFTPESLNHIGRLAAADVRNKYTQTGEHFNLAFKMINSDTKLVKTVLHSHGFTQCSRKNPSFNILWCGSAMRATQMRNIQPWQRLNQFPRSTELTRKDKLYDNIARSAALFGDAFSFIPEFFVTPRDASLLETAMKHSMTDFTFIVKPVSSSRGQGIFFASTAEEIPQTDTLLVSRYVENPLLVNGHKFDLRIYVAVTSFYPLIAYVYSEGLTRVASEKYCSEVGSRDAFVHLTNYSINKNNSNFVRNESMASEDFGHKWTLGALLRHLEKDGIDSKMLMLRIEDIIIKSLLSVQTRITSACRTSTPYIGTNFELFGFDILIDAELKPWLLEVNLSPSLSCDAPLDSLVKTRLICDLFNLACVPLVNRKLAGLESVRTNRDESYDSDGLESMSDKNKKLISPLKRGFTAKRRRPIRNAFITTPGGTDPCMRSICRRARAEMSRRGGFVRIFPRDFTLPLYRCVMDRVGSEKRDERLYLKEYGLYEDAAPENEGDLAQLYHEVIMNSALYPSLESVPLCLRGILREWHSSANAYVQRITKDGEKYAARLPVVRPSARLRTRSCSEWYEVRKATVAETKEKLRLQQDEIRLEERRGRENKENASPPTVSTS
ncbi:hypothetical protein GCK32_000462 [Trichostrongylus colubriformis]|uniref:Tubulin--tyrosine ligase-like protein 5 n=1 Tax=Trichostrongylus colubriformis TaxID=6319 RepID=A0AAN8I8J9_TRICO